MNRKFFLVVIILIIFLSDKIVFSSDSIQTILEQADSEINIDNKYNILLNAYKIDPYNSKILRKLAFVCLLRNDKEKSDFYLNQINLIKDNNKIKSYQQESLNNESDNTKKIILKHNSHSTSNLLKKIEQDIKKQTGNDYMSEKNITFKISESYKKTDIIHKSVSSETQLADIIQNLKENLNVPSVANRTNLEIDLSEYAGKELVNINKASEYEIENKLNLTEFESQLIVQYRNRIKKFSKKSDFREIPIIGQKYNLIKNKITVE